MKKGLGSMKAKFDWMKAGRLVADEACLCILLKQESLHGFGRRENHQHPFPGPHQTLLSELLLPFQETHGSAKEGAHCKVVGKLFLPYPLHCKAMHALQVCSCASTDNEV